MAEQKALDAKTIEYLTEALIKRSEIKIDKTKVLNVLSALTYDPNSKKTRFSTSDNEVELDHMHKDNYQTAEDDGSCAMIHLRRIIKNQALPYTSTNKGIIRKIQEAAYKKGLIMFDSNVVSRLVREDPKTLPLILKSAEQGYKWSVLGLYVKTYYSENSKQELTLRRPIIAIPGITAPEDLETLTHFEDLFQRPTPKEFLKLIDKYKV